MSTSKSGLSLLGIPVSSLQKLWSEQGNLSAGHVVGKNIMSHRKRPYQNMPCTTHKL